MPLHVSICNTRKFILELLENLKTVEYGFELCQIVLSKNAKIMNQTVNLENIFFKSHFY